LPPRSCAKTWRSIPDWPAPCHSTNPFSWRTPRRSPQGGPVRWPVANRHDDLDPNHLGKPEALGNASVLTADAFCTSVGLQRLDFVKVDVDGYEHSVLRGFRENLRRFRPRILVELAPFAYGDLPAHEFADFINFLSGLGYDFIQANTGRPISSDRPLCSDRSPPGRP